MNFDTQPSVLSQQPQQQQQQGHQQIPVQEELSLTVQPVDDLSGVAGVVDTGQALVRGVDVVDSSVLPGRGRTQNPAQVVQGYEGRDRLYVVDAGAVPVMPVMAAADGMAAAGMVSTKQEEEEVKAEEEEEEEEAVPNYFDEGGPKQKRRHLDAAAGIVDCGQTVGVYSQVSSVLGQESLVPRKGRAGLRKSTDTRKNNNRVALRDFTCGRRCVTDVVTLDPPMVAHLKVVSGVSTEKVLRKNKKSMLLDIGQQFGVLQLFVEGHPKPDEKVWVTTSRGLVPVPSTAVEQTMAQLTISVRDFPVIARGRVRRDPQKQGTRPKAGEPIVDCYGIFVGDEGRPLWIESSLISVEPANVVATQQPPVVGDQLPIQSLPPTAAPAAAVSTAEPSNVTLPLPASETVDASQRSQP